MKPGNNLEPKVFSFVSFLEVQPTKLKKTIST